MATTKNLELYFQHSPLADLSELALISTTGMVNGLIVEVAEAGLFQLQMPAVSTPDGRDVITGNGGGVWIRQTLSALNTTAGGAIDFASGGTSALTQQTALDAIAGAVTSTYYLRGNGTHVSMSAIQASDVPTLNQDTSGTAAKATNIAGGTSYDIPYQTDVNETAFISAAASSVLVTDGSSIPSLSTTLPAVAAGSCTCTDPTTSASGSIDTALSNVLSAVPGVATNIEGGDANYIPYQTATDTTDFITAANSSVLVTDGSGVPSLSTTLPAVEAGSCTCTDPTTSTSESINDALANVYSAITPPLTYTAHVSSFSLDPTSANAQTITGAQVVLPAGKYLISYSLSGTFTPVVANVGAAHALFSYLVATPTVSMANTSFGVLNGNVLTGSEIFGGTASVSVVYTFATTTTLDVTAAFVNAAAGSTLTADEVTITAIRLSNTVSTYTAHTASPVALDSTSTSPQIVTGAQLTLPIGTYLLSYSVFQGMSTQVGDAGTPFAATSVIYNTTAAANIANTLFTSFSGYAETGAEKFGGTSSATVVATFAAPTTLDVYATLSDASDAADNYAATSTITAVKLD